MSNTNLHILDGPEAWHGDDLALDDRWRFHLNEADLVEIDAAVSAVRDAGKIWSDMTSKADFPLPGLFSGVDLDEILHSDTFSAPDA